MTVRLPGMRLNRNEGQRAFVELGEPQSDEAAKRADREGPAVRDDAQIGAPTWPSVASTAAEALRRLAAADRSGDF